MRRACVGVVASVLFGCAAPTPPGPPPREVAPESDLARKLGEAYDALARSEAGGPEADKARARFDAVLRETAPDLPEVVPEKGGAKTYTKLTLNAEKKGLGAFRFRTPDGEANWDMNWEFVAPDGAIRSWYILPREGTMDGFRTFKPDRDYREAGADLPGKNFRVVQPLDGGVLKPGADYVIWFTFEKPGPVAVHVRIGLTEATKAKD